MKRSARIIGRIFIVALVAGLVMVGFSLRRHHVYNKPGTPGLPAQPTARFDKQQYSIDTASSLWVVVNKRRALDPSNYVPSNLAAPAIALRLPASNPEMQVRSDTGQALVDLFAGAKQAGLNLMLVSGYRSYNEQVVVYNGYVKDQGRAAADTSSARPGFSEHQTGLAADVGTTSRRCELEQCFADTPEGKWLAANAYTYGFIIRYTTAKQAITGYENEPWHLRYVGTALSQEMHSKNISTLEEFFGLPAAPNYQ